MPASSSPLGDAPAQDGLARAQRVAYVLTEGRPSLLQVLEDIARFPLYELSESLSVSAGDLEDATDVAVEAIPDLATQPGMLEPSRDDTVHAESDGFKLRLSQLPARRMLLSVHTRPNRFVKRFVQQAVRVLRAAPEHARLRRRLQALMATGELAEVAPIGALTYQSSAVLERDARYRRVLAAALALRPELSPASR